MNDRVYNRGYMCHTLWRTIYHISLVFFDMAENKIAFSDDFENFADSTNDVGINDVPLFYDFLLDLQ